MSEHKNAALVAAAVVEARKVPVTKIGTVVGHDSTDLAGKVLLIADGIATVDFAQGGIRRLPIAECFDVNLVKAIAFREKQRRGRRGVAF